MNVKGPAARDKRVVLQNPGPAAPDGDGGFTHTWTDLDPPTEYAAILPATPENLERVVAGTVVASATHLVFMPWRALVTTLTRVIYDGRRFSVVGVANPDEANKELQLTCEEIVT